MIGNGLHEAHQTNVSSCRRGLSLGTCALTLLALVGPALNGLQAQVVARTTPAQVQPALNALQAGAMDAPRPAVPSPAPLLPPIPQPALDPFQIDPTRPAKDLLPTAPKVEKIRPLTTDDLTQVPEIQLQEPMKKDSLQLDREAGFLLAKINQINGKDRDGFLKALVAERPDLVGLPFAMGDKCRTKGERNRQLTVAVATVRQALNPATGIQLQGPVTRFAGGFPQEPQLLTQPPPVPPVSGPSVPQVAPAPNPAAQAIRAEVQPNTLAASFWTQYQALCDQQDATQARADKEQYEHITTARIAALMQILGPESPSLRLGLVKYLAAISHVEATRALARLALFTTDEEVRLAALAALQVRRERDYTDILVGGLRYPWPQVARNAADAIVRLKRTDLVPQLVAVLEEPDPRAPVVQEVDSKKVTMVNEMVRINHHRNCAMCHAPGNNGDVPAGTLTAGMPLPNEPLTGPTGGYRNSRQDLLVRIDVTYLRQDFSLLQPVADANPWPEMQRFDFLVRSRPLSEEEAAEYKEKFAGNDPTRPSPYQKAALVALREITGRDTAPTGEAWRKILDLPARKAEKGLKDISVEGPTANVR